jgi:hypothetical protein
MGSSKIMHSLPKYSIISTYQLNNKTTMKENAVQMKFMSSFISGQNFVFVYFIVALYFSMFLK